MRVLLTLGDAGERHRLAAHLRKQSADVTEAHEGSLALERLAVSSFDVLVIEVGGSTGDGFALAEQARSKQPGIKIIYASDWSGKSRPVSGAVFLERPVRLSVLDEALRWLSDLER